MGKGYILVVIQNSRMMLWTSPQRKSEELGQWCYNIRVKYKAEGKSNETERDAGKSLLHRVRMASNSNGVK